MTSEEARDEYSKACTLYEEAVSTVNALIDALNEMELRLQQLIRQRNDMEDTEKRFAAAKEQMIKPEVEAQITEQFAGVRNELQNASDFFSEIAASSEGKIDLAAHIMSDESARHSRDVLDGIFGSFQKANAQIQNGLEDSRKKLDALEGNISDLEKAIQEQEISISYWRSIIKKSQEDQEIYWSLYQRRLDEEAALLAEENAETEGE